MPIERVLNVQWSPPAVRVVPPQRRVWQRVLERGREALQRPDHLKLRQHVRRRGSSELRHAQQRLDVSHGVALHLGLEAVVVQLQCGEEAREQRSNIIEEVQDSGQVPWPPARPAAKVGPGGRIRAEMRLLNAARRIAIIALCLPHHGDVQRRGALADKLVVEALPRARRRKQGA